VAEGAVLRALHAEERRREQNVDQQMLFNEVEVLAAIETADEAHRQRSTTIDAHERKRSADAHRMPIPEHFPRIEIVHDLAPDEKLCTRCTVPHPLTRIGQEIRECYRFEPPTIRVEQHIRPTYVCEERHEAPVTAPAPPLILPKSMASPSCWRTSSNRSSIWGCRFTA